MDYLFTMVTKLVAALTGLVAVAIALSGCSQDSDAAGSSSEPSSSASAESVSLLFGQTALSASLVDHPDSSRDEQVWTLTLRGVDTITGVFSDRPAREASRIKTAEFVADWDDLFGDDPPNAMISTDVSEGRAGVVAVVLSEPAYDSGAETLIYRAKPIQPTGNQAEDYSLSSTNEDLPQEFGKTEIFIDSALENATQLGRS